MFFPESPETASRRASTVVACAPFRALTCVLGGFPYNDQTQTSLHVNSSSYITYTPLSACARPLFQVSGLHTVPRGSVKRASRFSIAISLIQYIAKRIVWSHPQELGACYLAMERSRPGAKLLAADCLIWNDSRFSPRSLPSWFEISLFLTRIITTEWIEIQLILSCLVAKSRYLAFQDDLTKARLEPPWR